ncbi:hypothetical protein KO02_12980 [Sphingobacterium sp. ML3W]|uniref:ROK family protein n=1 Tax=Sphingobacterium sp. ML3W TaxID=1538644 RepID=UPI0004F5A491|nr:ROK family protein [Sphingobacterium sp. ML3W]AIM37501.1 hypothetical protein KO02_12980 [Sphingobacterium sp. ML3W]
MKDKIVICIDIGGSHIAAASLKKEFHRFIPIKKAKGPVDSAANRETILAQWDNIIQSIWDVHNQDIQNMIIAIPGPFDYENGICLMDGMHKYQTLLHMDIKSHFLTQYAVPSENIKFINDAEAFLLGEIYHHNLQKKHIVGLSLGTGLGSACYNGSEVKDLNYGSAPFRAGIAEDYISTRGMLEYLRQQGIEGIVHIKALVDTETLANERAAAFSFLAKALVDFIKLHILPLKPDGLILGGSIAKAHHLFLPAVQKEIDISIYIASFNDWNLFLGLATSFSNL